MNSKRKIYVIGQDNDYASWMEGDIINKMEDANLVVLTGGADVTPSLYGEKAHFTTQNHFERDKYELAEYNKARQLNIPIIGICRGSQFLCAMAGGKLVQHMGASGFHHRILTYDNKEVITTSSHHQSQYPWELVNKKEAYILGWTFNESKYHLGGNGEEMVLNKVPENKECEIVYYPKINACGVQGHPEWMQDHEDIVYYQNLLNKFLDKRLDKELKVA